MHSAYAWSGNHLAPQAGELLVLDGVSASWEEVIGLGKFTAEVIRASRGRRRRFLFAKTTASR
jgi:hypothetical protein